MLGRPIAARLTQLVIGLADLQRGPATGLRWPPRQRYRGAFVEASLFVLADGPVGGSWTSSGAAKPKRA